MTSFGKEHLTRLTICSLCILTICNFSYCPFGFEGGISVLIAPVPGHLRRCAANDKIFKLFFLHPFLPSTIYNNTTKNKFDIG